MRASMQSLFNLEDNLLLFFTGFSRSAGAVLSDQKTRSEQGDAGIMANLHAVKALGLDSKRALERGDVGLFGEIMHAQWEQKKRRFGGMTNPQIDEWYELGRSSGALGGKLVGAGGGGFLMFYAEDHRRLREAMAKGRAGRSPVPVRLRRHQGALLVSLPVAVLAGGLATRLRPLTEQVPKILIEIAGRAFADHQLDLLQRWGVSEVVYCLGYRGEQVIAALGDGSDRQMRFTYVSDGPRLAGTGGALRLALPFLGDAFFVMYGDSYLQCDFHDVERDFRASGKPGLMTVFRNEGRWDRSNVAYERGRILRYDKTSPGEHDASMHYIDYGLGILTPEALAPWAGVDTPFDLSVVYQRLIERDTLAGFEVAERFYEIGSIAGLEETRALIIGHRLQGRTR